MIYNTTTPRRSVLDRSLRLDRLGTEVLLYGLLFVLSIFLHLWQLDVKAMHHDEAIHAWMSYKFFTGTGSFECAGTTTDASGQVVARQSTTYCYNPVYHGPSLYVLTLLSYFLFGVGDAQARLPMALAGIALVPMAWTLRPHIGRKGAFIAATLMTLSPSILYYTRFARHDALVLPWALFMVVGLFNWLRKGGVGNLALAAAGLSLAWATHELVFILIFIGGSFFAFRLLWEWRARVFWGAMAAALLIALGFIAIYFGVSEAQSPTIYSILHRLLGPMLMLGVGALLTAPMALAWERDPIVMQRIVETWRHERRVYWIALGTFLAIFALLFSTFFAYPLGFLDGWYQGIRYWLGSQQEYARGGQPWFYYLMLMPIYDLLALVFSLAGLAWLLAPAFRRRRTPPAEAIEAPTNGSNGHTSSPQPLASSPSLFVFFLGYWFVQSFVAFSWAGEKMPWLLTHISLPASLLAAWALAILIRRVPWRDLRYNYGWAVPLLTLVLLIAVFVGVFAFGGGDETVAGLRSRLAGLIPIAFAGVCLFGLLTIANAFGGRVVLRLAALTIAAVLLLYGVRAAVLVNFRTPDTPIEPLIYTQTAPDVPVLVDQIRELAINQSRNNRTAADPTGGYGMPIVLDGGASGSGGEGSLAWPMQWYLRDYTNIRWLDVDQQTIGTDAPIVVLYKPHVSQVEDQLEEDYVQTSEGVFNWWFPEFTGDPDPDNPGQSPARGYKSLADEGIGAVLTWPLRPSNWPTLWSYMVYRDLPLELKGREMAVFMRRDVAPGVGAAQASVPTQTLTPSVTLAQDTLNNPRGMTVDSEGNVYVADANNHRVVVFRPDGEELRTIGSLGRGDGQLNEPSGVAVDDDGNIYVADTWNARIVKFDRDGDFVAAWGSSNTPFGEAFLDPRSGQQVQRYASDHKGDPQINESDPLGFFGPRNVLVRGDRVYIADTGNSRVVVTDLDGNFVQQFGGQGAGDGQMREPIGLGMDDQGRLFVGDTWNGRIQVFQTAEDGAVTTTPINSFAVRGWAANSYNDPYIAVAPDGRAWASQGARNTIAEFDAAQQYTRRLDSDPKFNAPKGVAWRDGTLYVVSSGNAEVLGFTLP